jgi:hypothetical protein
MVVGGCVRLKYCLALATCPSFMFSRQLENASLTADNTEKWMVNVNVAEVVNDNKIRNDSRWEVGSDLLD